MTITPSDAQEEAIKQIVSWYKSLVWIEDCEIIEPGQQQVFYVAGYAGVGKTAVTKIAVDRLEIDPEDVKYAAFTGKAALVMRRAGTPAQTLYSLIYAVYEATEQEVEEEEKKLIQLQINLLEEKSFDGRLSLQTEIEKKKLKIKDMKEPHFALNEASKASMAKLIVLDEVSMVGEEDAAATMSFGKPILVLGDPGQLPPIRGEGAFTNRKPDVFLTEIHRQAEGSPIIQLATMARRGIPIPYGPRGGDDVWKMHRGDLDPVTMFKTTEGNGQVICGLNATRLDLNNRMRWAAGFDHNDPVPQEGSKIICLRNRNSVGLVNGQFIELRDIVKVENDDYPRFYARIYDETDQKYVGRIFGGEPETFQIYSGHFEDHIAFDKTRLDRDWKRKKGLIEATYGWAITCHKAQGSSFDPVIVWDDHMGRAGVDRQRWLYTAITRAVSRLIILD